MRTHDRIVDGVALGRMIGTGWVPNARAPIFLAGRGKQGICLPNTRVLLHQPVVGPRAPATDIHAREIARGLCHRINRSVEDLEPV